MPMRSPRRALIIDDDREIARGLSVRLRAKGYDVRIVRDGENGLAAARDYIPHGIILDVRMPGMDGYEVLAALKQDSVAQNIPVLVLSANTPATTRSHALQLGASRFVRKPFQADELISTFEAAISEALAPALQKAS